MSVGLHGRAVPPVSSRRGWTRRTWPAVLTVLALACVTPPAPASASEPAKDGARCDGGPCGTQPTSAQGATPAAAPAPSATPPASPAPPPTAPTTASPAPVVPSPTTTSEATPAPASPSATSGTAPAPTAPAASPAAAAPDAPGAAQGTRLCDSDWEDGQLRLVYLGQRKDDGQPLLPYNPRNPMQPYELRGDRYLFGERKLIIKVVGRFEDDKEAEEALREVQTRHTHLYTGSYRPFVSLPGPYFVNEAPACKVTRESRINPIFDPASWVLEKNGVLLVGTRTECKNGQRTKQVTVVSCDTKKNLLTDTVSVPCDAGRVDTCIHALAPDVFLFEHDFTSQGATSIRLRTYDVKKKKRVHALDTAHEGGPETELTSVTDIDQDGVPEIVTTVAGTGERTSVLKWRKSRFVESKTP